MSSASLEATLELWSTMLRQTKQRIDLLFAAPSVDTSASAFLNGLLGGERRRLDVTRIASVPLHAHGRVALF
jgi:hypothetical protein